MERHYVRLFERAPAALAERQNLSFSTPEGDSETLVTTLELGYRRGDGGAFTTARPRRLTLTERPSAG